RRKYAWLSSQYGHRLRYETQLAIISLWRRERCSSEKWTVSENSTTCRRKSGRAPKHLMIPGNCFLPDRERQKSYAAATSPVASASSVIRIFIDWPNCERGDCSAASP